MFKLQNFPIWNIFQWRNLIPSRRTCEYRNKGSEAKITLLQLFDDAVKLWSYTNLPSVAMAECGGKRNKKRNRVRTRLSLKSSTGREVALLQGSGLWHLLVEEQKEEGGETKGDFQQGTRFPRKVWRAVVSPATFTSNLQLRHPP